MSDVARGRAQKLINLALSDNEHEARNAAVQACRLIAEHDLLNRPEDHVETLTAATVKGLVQYVAKHKDRSLGVSTVLQSEHNKLSKQLPPELYNRAYHRARARLESLVKQGLLERDPGLGYGVARGVRLKQFPEELRD